MELRPEQIIRSKTKSIALIVQRDGRLVVRAPLRTPQAHIEAVLSAKEGWIREKQELNRRLWREQAPRTFNGGEEFLYLGKSYRLAIVEQQKQALEFRDGFYLRRSGIEQGGSIFEKWYRERARMIFSERVELYARRHEMQYKSIRISGARTRWGSCGAKGTLNFSWRLAMAPLEVIDYVVIHELAHLEEKNHSRRYWERVERLMPDYRQRRQWLKKNGERLKL
ncbi:MAG: hypothetical protein A2Z16_11590 [Chloroflexi bacterium RBG_16_54_18]|nr:MAG: hypothetical protein A2Z16_11590 [Chloroflexi bacterium RBG_16_54_18]